MPMAKQRKPDGEKPSEGKKPPGPVLFIRLSEDEEAALTKFIGDQVVPPDRSAVGKTALHQFLAEHGYWPPKQP